MDLMSSLRLLLCAVATTLPGALGVSRTRLTEIKLNNSLTINQKQPTHKILLNINGPPLVKAITELQSVFKDIVCRNCATCMERAIKAQKVHSHVINNQPNAQELYYDVLNNNDRTKRNTIEQNDLEGKIEQGKRVAATVTRYTKERKVIAIEVKDINENDKRNCKVYIVRKTLPCDLESDLISASKKKTTKKSKKGKDKTSVSTEAVTVLTAKTESMPSAYRKREVDNSQVAESYMLSIEELY